MFTANPLDIVLRCEDSKPGDTNVVPLYQQSQEFLTFGREDSGSKRRREDSRKCTNERTWKGNVSSQVPIAHTCTTVG